MDLLTVPGQGHQRVVDVDTGVAGVHVGLDRTEHLDVIPVLHSVGFHQLLGAIRGVDPRLEARAEAHNPMARVAFLLTRLYTAPVGHLGVTVCDLPREVLPLGLTAREASHSDVVDLGTPLGLRPVLLLTLGDRHGEEVFDARLARVGTALDSERVALIILIVGLVQVTGHHAADRE